VWVLRSEISDLDSIHMLVLFEALEDIPVVCATNVINNAQRRLSNSMQDTHQMLHQQSISKQRVCSVFTTEECLPSCSWVMRTACINWVGKTHRAVGNCCCRFSACYLVKQGMHDVFMRSSTVHTVLEYK
jgi:hypothetical protein